MANWLKALGSTQRPLRDDWREEQNGVLTQHVTFARRPIVQKGDRVIYYAAGTKLIFAFGVVTSHPYEEHRNSSGYPWRTDVSLEVAKKFVHDGVRLEFLNTPDSRNPIGNRIKRRSHVQISEGEFNVAARELRR